jgi:hypothetical protein
MMNPNTAMNQLSATQCRVMDASAVGNIIKDIPIQVNL